jgi:hypothetical protein
MSGRTAQTITMVGQWPTQGGNSQQTGTALVPGPIEPFLIHEPPFAKWRVQRSYPSTAAVINDRGIVLFIDQNTYGGPVGLIGLNRNGDYLPWSPWQPPGSVVANYTGPSLDKAGKIYVLGQQSLYVLQLSSDGSSLSIVASYSYTSLGPYILPYALAPRSPVIGDDGTVYIYLQNGGSEPYPHLILAALTLQDGSLQSRWVLPAANSYSLPGNYIACNISLSPPHTGHDFVYCATNHSGESNFDCLTALNQQDGTPAWTYNPPSGLEFVPPVAVGPDGELYLTLTGSLSSDATVVGGIIALTPGPTKPVVKWQHWINGDVWADNIQPLCGISPPALSLDGSRLWFCYQCEPYQTTPQRVVELNISTGEFQPHNLPPTGLFPPSFPQPAIDADDTCFIGGPGGNVYLVRPGGDQQSFPIWNPSTGNYSWPGTAPPAFYCLAIGPVGTLYASADYGQAGMSSELLAWGGLEPVIARVEYDGSFVVADWIGSHLSDAGTCTLSDSTGNNLSTTQTGTKLSNRSYRTTFRQALPANGIWTVEVSDGGYTSDAARVVTSTPVLITCTYDDPTLTVAWSGTPSNAVRMILELTPLEGHGRMRRFDLGLSTPAFVQLFLPRTVPYQAVLRGATRISFGPKSNNITITGRWLPAPTIVPTQFPSATTNGDRTLAGAVALAGSGEGYGIKIYAADGLQPGAPLPTDYNSWQSVSDLVAITNGRWSTQAPAGQYFQASLIELDYTGNPVAPTMPSVGMGAVSTSALIAGRLPQLNITQRPFQTGGMLAGTVIDLDTMAPASESTYWILVTYQPVSGSNAGQWCPASSWGQGFQGYCSIAADGTWALTFPKAVGAVSAASFAAMLIAGPAGATAPPFAYTDYKSVELPTVDYQNVLGVTMADPMAGTATMTLPPYSDGGITAGRIDYIAPQTSEVVILASSSASGPWQQANPAQCVASLSGNWATNVTASAYYATVVIPRRQPNSPPLTHTTLPTPDQHQVFAVTPAVAAAPRPESRALALAQTNKQKPELQYMAVTALPLDAPVFSIECWVRPILPGCLVSYGPAASIGSGLILEALEDGVVRLRLIASDQTSLLDLKSNATDMLDGSWHHVAVARSLLGAALYVDGKLAASQEWTASKNANQRLVSAGTLYLGANGALSSTPTDPLSGAVGELRVWTRAIEPLDIVSAMYQRLTGTQTGLLGHWNFDNGSCADSSGNHYDGTLIGSPSFTADAVTLVRPGEPYLTTQAVLMEDYGGSSTNPKEITAYRIVVKAHSGDTSPMQHCEVQIAVVPPDLDLPQDADHIPTPPPYASGTIIVQGAGGFLTPPATLAAPYTMTADLSGELSFCLQADSDYLFAPLVKVRAAFMGQDEWLVISPDRHLHSQLTTLSGGQLNRIVVKSTDKTSELDPDGAEAVARAVRNLAATAGEHDLESSHPVVRSGGNGQELSGASGAGNQGGDTAQAPIERRYQNGLVTRDAYMPMNNVIAPDLVTGTQSVARIASAEAMSDKDFMVTWDEGLKQPVFTSDVTLIATESERALGVKLANDPLTMLLLSGPSYAPISRAAYVAALRASAGPQEIGFGSFRNFLKNAKGFIVSTVKKVIEETKQIVSHVVIAVRNALNELEKWVVTTAEQAIGAIQGLLENISVKIKEVIAFFRQVFAWDDILVSQHICQQELQKIIPRVITFLSDFKPQILGQFDNWRTKIDRAFTQLDQKLAGAAETLAGQNLQAAQTEAAMAGPADIRSGYLVQMTNVGVAGPGASIDYTPTLSERLGSSTALMPVFEQLSPQLDGFGTTVGESGLAGVLANPQSIFSGSLGVFTEIVRTLLDALKTLVDAGIDLAKAAVGKLVDFVVETLSALDGLLSAHITIPLVTPLYEKVIMRGHGQLTAYSLVSLLGAVPFTIAYKATHQGTAPFVSASMEARAVGGDGISTEQKTAGPPSAALMRTSHVLGFVAGSSILVLSVASIVREVTKGPVKEKAATFALVFEAAAWISTVPLMSYASLSADKHDDDALWADYCDIALWFTQGIGVVLDAVDALGEELKVKQPFKKPVMPALVCIVGIASLGWAIALCIYDGKTSTSDDGSVVLVTAANVSSFIPQLVQAAKYTEALKRYVPAFVFLGYALWGGITFIRAVVAVAVDEQLVFNARRASKHIGSQ